MNAIIIGTLGSLVAGLATSLGALPVFFFNRMSQRLYANMLGFSAGIMLAATFFSLLVPALQRGNIIQVISGFGAGVLFLELADRIIPHEHFLRGKEGMKSHFRRVFLLILALTIHNFPEGMSVGVGFAAGDMPKAMALAIGIGIQNIPEGTAVALPLRGLGFSRRYAFGIATLTGLVEPIGGFCGACLVVIFSKILPVALAFAAGCMLHVTCSELIPEAHEGGHGKHASRWLIIGFMVMMILDNVFSS